MHRRFFQSLQFKPMFGEMAFQHGIHIIRALADRLERILVSLDCQLLGFDQFRKQEFEGEEREILLFVLDS